MTLAPLLLRSLIESRNRAFHSVDNGAVYFGTDVGLRREENQDRVAVVRWHRFEQSQSHPVTAVIVSDGMGGMQDGALCAAKAISTFAASLIDARSSDLRLIAEQAANVANDAVYSDYRGRGGATLSAVIVAADGLTVGLNVGDSRLYAPLRADPAYRVQRLTVDDTMKEAYGSEGSGLLQFIGVGPGLRPHLFNIDNSNLVAITTDGAHFVEQSVFSEVMSRSPDPKAIVERAIALSRWLGAPDNTTVAALDMQRIVGSAKLAASELAKVWIAGNDGPLYFIAAEKRQEPPPAVGQTIEKDAAARGVPVEAASTDDVKKPIKQKRKRKVDSRTAAEEQLTIDVEVTKDSRPDADS